MIIFDLDGTLADCEHRRHLINPEKYPKLFEYCNYRIINSKPVLDLDGKSSWRYKETGEPFQHGWQAFYEACENDKPIEPVCTILDSMMVNTQEIEVWSGRCESVRKKTENWFDKHIRNIYVGWNFELVLKMRPIGDYTPDDVLKEIWYNDMLTTCQYQSVNNGTAVKMSRPVEMVFTANVKEVAMWRRRGIFVFNCAQHDEEF